MIANALLKAAGKIEGVIFRFPMIGEPVIRGINRSLAHAAFHTPFLGGKKGISIVHVKKEWIRFLKNAGINIRVTGEDKDAFHWEADACPYGYCKKDQRGVCDAVMDLDRTYTRLLGGELIITARIPDGSSKCQYTTRLIK